MKMIPVSIPRLFSVYFDTESETNLKKHMRRGGGGLSGLISVSLQNCIQSLNFKHPIFNKKYSTVKNDEDIFDFPSQS